MKQHVGSSLRGPFTSIPIAKDKCSGKSHFHPAAWCVRSALQFVGTIVESEDALFVLKRWGEI
jgi:hypothetical protein